MNEISEIRHFNFLTTNHTIIVFVNGSRACSCGLEHGAIPNLRKDDE